MNFIDGSIVSLSKHCPCLLHTTLCFGDSDMALAIQSDEKTDPLTSTHVPGNCVPSACALSGAHMHTLIMITF